MPLRVVFMGTPDFAVPTLVEIVGGGHEVAAVYSQPPRPAGRGMAERPSPVQVEAKRFGIPVLTPRTLRDPDVQAAFAAHEADIAVVVAYGLILPPVFLEAPAEGCLNLHASLLPRWRGAAPIQRAIMAGDAETGVAVMRMAQGLDTGPVCMAERVAIGADETAGALAARLARLGADLMLRALGAIERGSLTCRPQDAEGVFYAAKVDKAEARIDWTTGAEAIARKVNGLSPFPGAWCEWNAGGARERLKLLRAAPLAAPVANDASAAAPPGMVLSADPLTIAAGTGAVRLLEVQRSGRPATAGADFARGARLAPGALLE